MRFVTIATKDMKVSPRRVIAMALAECDEQDILDGSLTIDQAREAIYLWYSMKQENVSGEAC